MMRVLGKSLVVAAGVALLATTSAKAAPFKDYSRLADTRIPIESPSAGPRVPLNPYVTGFEAGEDGLAFQLGEIDLQSIWTGLVGNPADPSQGQLIVNSNGRPGQSFKLGKDVRYGCTSSDLPPGRVRGARANNLDPVNNVINTDIFVPAGAFGGADFVVQPQTTQFGYTTARLRFTYTGQIIAPDFALGVYVDTLVGVQYDAWMTVEFVLHPDPIAPTYDVYAGADKNNLVLLLAGLGAVPGSQGTSNNIAIYSDNCQNFATDPTEGAYIDNVEHKPEPGSLALLAIGGLLALRRRR